MNINSATAGSSVPKWLGMYLQMEGTKGVSVIVSGRSSLSSKRKKKLCHIPWMEMMGWKILKYFLIISMIRCTHTYIYI